MLYPSAFRELASTSVKTFSHPEASIWEYTFSEWSESQSDEYYEMLISAGNRLLYPSIICNRYYDEITNGLLGIKAGHHVIFYKIMDNDDVMVIRILNERMDI